MHVAIGCFLSAPYADVYLYAHLWLELRPGEAFAAHLVHDGGRQRRRARVLLLRRRQRRCRGGGSVRGVQAVPRERRRAGPRRLRRAPCCCRAQMSGIISLCSQPLMQGQQFWLGTCRSGHRKIIWHRRRRICTSAHLRGLTCQTARQCTPAGSPAPASPASPMLRRWGPHATEGNAHSFARVQQHCRRQSRVLAIQQLLRAPARCTCMHETRAA